MRSRNNEKEDDIEYYEDVENQLVMTIIDYADEIDKLIETLPPRGSANFKTCKKTINTKVESLNLAVGWKMYKKVY